MARGRRPDALMYGVTAGVSAWALLKGQLADMSGRGWDVSIVASDDERLRAASAREGVRAVPLPMEREIAPLADVRSLVGWIGLLLRERPSVLNVGTPKAALLGMLSGALTRVPRRVYVVRGLRFEGTTGRKRALLLAMERLTIRCATDVVVVSRSVGEVMLDAGLDARPLLLVGDGSSNGVDGAGIAKRAAAVNGSQVREEFGVSNDSLLVAYVGRLTLDKGAEMLVGALHALRERGVEVTLMAIGDSESEEAAALLRDPRIEVVLTGWSDDPIEYVAASDVLVLPTRREGYPNVVLEANACGVPVVTTRATGARDSVVDGLNGLLVDVDDADALADALRLLQGDEARRRTLATNARERALTRFAPTRIWDGLDSIYRGQPSKDVEVVTK